MPVDHSRKAAIRQRMAETGENFHRAAKAVDHERLVAVLTTPPCGVPGHDWRCESCPELDLSNYDCWGRPWRGPGFEPYVCPGPSQCEDLDCSNGCNDHFVKMCHDCGHIFGVGFHPDPEDGSCPNGCSRDRFRG